MRKVTLWCERAWVAAVLTFVSGCAPALEDSSKMNCSKFNETFFSKPTTVQLAEFPSLDLEDQYAIFICGNQTREPPSIHLATAFAKEGPGIVGFLMTRLMMARGDLTIRDIVLVFAEMSRLDTYDVSSDDDLMKALAEAVGRVKDPDWRKTCEQSLSEIQQHAKHKAH